MHPKKLFVIVGSGVVIILALSLLTVVLVAIFEKRAQDQQKVLKITQMVNAAIADADQVWMGSQHKAALDRLRAIQVELEQSGVQTLIPAVSSRLSSAIASTEAAARDFDNRVAEYRRKCQEEARKKAEREASKEKEQAERKASEERAAKAKQEANPVVSNVTWREYMSSCGIAAQNANGVRAERAFESKYKGQFVRWGGTIARVESIMLSDGYVVGVKMNPTESLSSDVLLLVPAEFESEVMSLKSGQKLIFVGKIESQGGAIMDHTVRVTSLWALW